MASKPTIGLLLGMSKGKPSEPDSEESDAKVMAAKAVMRAVKSGDASALSSALAAHYDACMSADEYENEE